MGKVFISYAHEDEEKARRIKQRLDEVGFVTWIDRSAPTSRDDISTVIDGQLATVDAVLVLWSPSSRASVWVRGEALKGLEGSKYFGLLLDAMVPPVPFNAIAAPDLTDWTGLNDHLGWDALVRGLAETSDASATILARLEAAQFAERDEAARLANKQERLPLEEPEEPLDEGPAYTDVDAIVSAARTLIGGAAKLNLSSALIQAALDEELLRDAALVVCDGEPPKRPSGARFEVVKSVQAALKRCKPNDLIVVQRGTYSENIRISENVRIVGLGSPSERPMIKAKGDKAALVFATSARVENLSFEARGEGNAIYCERGQPAILRCDVRRFAEACDKYDGAFYVGSNANPIVIATSIASTGCHALYLASKSGGQFIGVNVLALRGDGVNCRGRAKLSACTVEAIGGHAVAVANSGAPSFEECMISGRGASVVSVIDSGYPRIKESRVSAIRQLAFDFSGRASGRIEGNIVSVERDPDAGTGRTAKSSGFFGLLKSKENAVVKASLKVDEFAKLRGEGKPLFLLNTTPTGEVLQEPISFRDF